MGKRLPKLCYSTAMCLGTKPCCELTSRHENQFSHALPGVCSLAINALLLVLVMIRNSPFLFSLTVAVSGGTCLHLRICTSTSCVLMKYDQPRLTDVSLETAVDAGMIHSIHFTRIVVVFSFFFSYFSRFFVLCAAPFRDS